LVHKIQLFLGRGSGVDVEALAVVFAKPEFPDGIAVFPGAIALVAVPAVMGEFGMESLHVFIPPGLGQDARRGDRRKSCIALDDTAMWNAFVFGEAVTVDQE